VATFILSDLWPSPGASFLLAFYDTNGSFLRNEMGSRQSTSSANQWQECVSIFRSQIGDSFVTVKFELQFQPLDAPSGVLWADEFYLGEGIGFNEQPSPKKKFDGTMTRIDSLGNIEVLTNNQWEPFFPIGIYSDWLRPEWSIYSRQGFNTVMWATNLSSISRAKTANMFSGLDLSEFLMSGVGDGTNYGNSNKLRQTLEEIKTNSPNMDGLLWYYWDNENAYDEWKVPLELTNLVKGLDVNSSGKRMHPIYALQGNEGLARRYQNDFVQMTDVVGAYVTADTPSLNSEKDRGSFSLILLDHLQKQTNPVVIAQINHGVGLAFRARVYSALAHGAKGFAFWKDAYQSTTSSFAIDILNEPWWGDLPNIKNEIDLLLPILRQPHWTQWTVTSNTDRIDFGTRDYNGKAFLIVSNEQSEDLMVTLTLSNFKSYSPKSIINFFSNQKESPILQSQFTLKIPRYGTGVYFFEN
jgi:hypothetical protein